MDIDPIRPLDEAWRDLIDGILREIGRISFADTARLARSVEEVSRIYNAGLASSGTRAPIEGRIAFSFARDVPKGAAAVRELVMAGLLPMPAGDARGPLRVVDLGAGLGAMTWGIARAIHGADTTRKALRIEALLVDDDADALRAAGAIARAARAAGLDHGAFASFDTRAARVTTGMKLPEADVVVLGQVLSEMDRGLTPAERAAAHADLVDDLLARIVAKSGSLVIVEPALRERSRHLHAVRDVLVARGRTVFAPCLHQAACPMLAAGEGEWCHDDLPVDLPPWLVPLARAAGLRFQGLTFSHLVLRRDGATLDAELQRTTPSPEKMRLRVVSDVLVTKGKTEIFGCTGGAAGGERVRLRRLDRDAQKDDAWSRLHRGDVVALDPPGGGRIGPRAAIDVWRGRR